MDVSVAVTGRIPKFKFHEPVLNLPGSNTSRGREARFTYRFAQAYWAQFRSLHRGKTGRRMVVAREVPANGYGIADLVAVSWASATLPHSQAESDAPTFLSRTRPTVRAFEAKLYDWRRALRQANRYRFFAHVPVVVMPASRLNPALRHLRTFRLLGIGLWSFDPKTDRIVTHFTPPRARPLDRRQSLRALQLVARAAKSRRVS